MMNANLAAGTRVVLTERSKVKGWFGVPPYVQETRRYGNVIEIGAGRNTGRLRVKWEYYTVSGGPSGGRTGADTKRTWIKADRLNVVPTETL